MEQNISNWEEIELDENTKVCICLKDTVACFFISICCPIATIYNLFNCSSSPCETAYKSLEGIYEIHNDEIDSAKQRKMGKIIEQQPQELIAMKDPYDTTNLEMV